MINECYIFLSVTSTNGKRHGGSNHKAYACNVWDPVRSLCWQDSPGEGNDNPLQYSCLENPMDGGAWWATVHGVAKSRTRLSDFTYLTFNRWEAIALPIEKHARIFKKCSDSLNLKPSPYFEMLFTLSFKPIVSLHKDTGSPGSPSTDLVLVYFSLQTEHTGLVLSPRLIIKAGDGGKGLIYQSLHNKKF